MKQARSVQFEAWVVEQLEGGLKGAVFIKRLFGAAGTKHVTICYVRNTNQVDANR